MKDDAEAVTSNTTDTERWTGTLFSFLSTFLFAFSHVSVRYMAGYKVDLDWILFYKEAIGLSLLIPWLLIRLYQGRFQFCSKRLLLYIVVSAVICQLIGARCQVHGYAVVGLIIAVPLILSSTLLGVALLGRYINGHLLSSRRKMAITILIAAVVIISIGKEMTVTGSSHANDAVSAGVFLLGAATAVAAGLAYAIYITILRYSIRQYWKDENSTRLSFKFRHWVGHDHVPQPGQRFYSPFPVTLTMSLVFAVGMVIFGTILYCRSGLAGFYTVPDEIGRTAWYCILISGVGNMSGFFFQIQGLRMTSAVQAQLIAVSQMLVLSLIGYFFFLEAVNVVVMIGLGLTIYGVFMSAKPER